MQGSNPTDIDLGQDGLNYLRGNLLRGHALSALVLETVPLEQGVVLTYASNLSDLPRDLDSEISKETSALQWKLVSERLIDLLQDGERVALFEHPFARPGDPWLGVKPIGYASYNNSVLFVAGRNWATPARITELLWEAGAHDERGVVLRLPQDQIETRKEVDENVIRSAMARLDLLLIRAFDADGYLIWLPHRPVPAGV